MELLILILICIILIGLYFFLLSNGKRNKAMQELAKSYKLSYRKYNKKIPLFLSATECNFIEGELKGKKVKIYDHYFGKALESSFPNTDSTFISVNDAQIFPEIGGYKILKIEDIKNIIEKV